MNTVVLVHGLTDNPGRMKSMASYLVRKGRTVLCPGILPSDGSAPIEQLAGILAAYIADNIANDHRIDLVGFSMGGLVCRYYLQCLSGADRTDRFISIASPNNGTKAAFLLRGAGIAQMRPQSQFLRMLNRDLSTLDGIACTVLYTPLDLIIIPSASSLMPSWRTVRFFAPAHPLMLYSPRVLATIDQLLAE